MFELQVKVVNSKYNVINKKKTFPNFAIERNEFLIL